MSELSTKCLIIGSGPAGYTAGIYTSRANLSPILIDGSQPGGQLITTTDVENFPGYPEGVSGPKMMEDFRAQAARFGLLMLSGEVTEVDFSKRPFTVKVNGGSQVITADTVIIATGAAARYLGLPDEQKYLGMGVSACATCDGFFFRNRPVAVVGGGDTACEEAEYLSHLASKVYMIVRKDYLRASKYMQAKVMDNPKIEVLFNTQTVSLFGEETLEGAHLVSHKGTENESEFDIAVEGFFLAIGHSPNTAVFGDAIELDEQGYIVTRGKSTATSVDGVFAAGDVADPVYQQAISAAGSGCRAALDAERFIMMNMGD
ncbi:MAG: thioredoxin-disulfide reductase [Muribaculaceae bacterium]|nr:thioredoxin-disulfide reductase [Muribaculaceae bacterium]